MLMKNLNNSKGNQIFRCKKLLKKPTKVRQKLYNNLSNYKIII